jgi:signal transduction histidine kinase
VTKAFQEQIDLDKLVEITRRIRSFESIDMKTRLFGECLKHGFLADDKLREIYERGELSRGQGYLYRLLTQTRVVIDNLTGGEEISLVNLTIVAEDAIKIQRSYDEKKIELKQPDFLDKDRFLLLVGKRVEWDLIFMNFLDNALKAVGAVSELRHGLVDIDFFVDPKKEILLITVEDNGVGIPQELLKSGAIFQRVSGFEKQGIGGTGVGLPHVKEIIESYAGEIKIESQEGVGTKIIIKLPLRT